MPVDALSTCNTPTYFETSFLLYYFHIRTLSTCHLCETQLAYSVSFIFLVLLQMVVDHTELIKFSLSEKHSTAEKDPFACLFNQSCMDFILKYALCIRTSHLISSRFVALWVRAYSCGQIRRG